MPESFRVGVIGACSAFSFYFAEAATEAEGVEFCGVADLGRDPKYMAEALNLPWLRHYPNTIEGYCDMFHCARFERPDEMVEAQKLDAVCVCTEDYLHSWYTRAMVEAGCHVFVPKPFAASHEEALAMFKAGKESGKVVMGAVPVHFDPPYMKAAELIKAGRIGRPLLGTFANNHHLSLDGWKGDPELASGPIYEFGFYMFDEIRMLMQQEPTRLTAYAGNLDHQGIPYIDNGVCIIEFEGGAMASGALRFGMHHRFPSTGPQLVGDEGGLIIDADYAKPEYEINIFDKKGVETVRVPKQGNYKGLEMINWVRICQNGEDPTFWQSEGLKTLDLMVAFQRSSESGQTVTFPLEGAEPFPQA